MQEKSVAIRIKTPKDIVYQICVLENHLFTERDIKTDKNIVYLDAEKVEELDTLIDGLQHLKELSQKDEV